MKIIHYFSKVFTGVLRRLAASNGWTVGGAFENAKKSFKGTNDESPAVADVQPVVYEAPSAEVLRKEVL